MFAHRHQQIRQFSDGSYYVGPMTHFTTPDVTVGQPFGFVYQDTLTVHIAPSDDWCESSFLKVIHGVHAIDMLDTSRHHTYDTRTYSPAGSVRTVDVFTVAQGGLVQSTKRYRHTFRDGRELVDHRNLDDMNTDNIYIPDDIATIIGLEDEMAAVTGADFSEIRREVTERIRMIDEGEELFTKKRHAEYSAYFDSE